MVLFGCCGYFKTNCLVYLFAETCVYIPNTFVDVHTACCIRQNVTLFVDGVLITLVACELSLYTIRQSPTMCKRMVLVGCEHPFADSLFTATCKVAFRFCRIFICIHRTVKFLLLRGTIVSVRTTNVKSKRK